MCDEGHRTSARAEWIRDEMSRDRMENSCYTDRMPSRFIWIITGIFLVAPMVTHGEAMSYEQDFIATAYYSPVPGQCCYVTGGLAADRVVNGVGVRAADGTEVYPGMAAAPAAYPFGTRIAVPGGTAQDFSARAATAPPAMRFTSFSRPAAYSDE